MTDTSLPFRGCRAIGISEGQRFRGRVVRLLSVAVAGSLSLLFLVALRPAKELNVILITVDTLRADHLGVYGYARNTSPNLDRFAKDSILFRHAFSHAPETNPSFSSLMTSFYPHETKVLRIFHALPPGAVTMAEILKANGYHTGAVMSHFSLRRGSGFEQGFDEYDDRVEDRVLKRKERIAPKTTLAAIKWLEGNYKKKFFLWVHFDDPHGPYAPPPPYNTMFVERSVPGNKTLRVGEFTGGIPPYQQLGEHRDPEYYISQYDGEIRFFDQAFGDLIKKIQQLGLLDNSVLVFTSDHGEGMGEHNYYFAHGEFLYNALIHVPLILRFPGPSPAVKEVRSPVSHIDVLPTILDAVSIRHSHPFRGRNLLAGGEDRQIFSQSHKISSKYALSVNNMKLVKGAKYELYDIQKDFSENADLMEGDSSFAFFPPAAALKNGLDAIPGQDALRLGPSIVWAKGSAMRKELRGLGYVQ
jgi:arylsulfatase A-like enzyme